MLGVAFMAGTLVLNDTLTATFDNVFADANQGVDAVVRAPSQVALSYGAARPPDRRATADAVAAVDGVADVAPQVFGYAQLVGPDGRPSATRRAPPPSA